MKKRVFVIVLDSFGIGELPDAGLFNDIGCNTLRGISTSAFFDAHNLAKLGFFKIDGINGEIINNYDNENATGGFGRMAEKSMGKDTTVGHWELAGVISDKPLPVFPNGFPEDLLEELARRTGRGWLCNRPFSGTEVISIYGHEHILTGKLIIYTSADSVFQIAAHEAVVSLDELYYCCKIARELLVGEYGVGRVIARPFEGTDGKFVRTGNRHDFSLEPSGVTMLDLISKAGMDVISIGKIADIFAGRGITKAISSKKNTEGITKLIECMEEDFEGLCFLNLVDFDMLYGHRNDIDGYAAAITYFDSHLPEIISKLRDEDLLFITADHGCDPSFPGTDHTREYVPILVTGKKIHAVNLGTRNSFADLAATVTDYLDCGEIKTGESFLSDACI